MNFLYVILYLIAMTYLGISLYVAYKSFRHKSEAFDFLKELKLDKVQLEFTDVVVKGRNRYPSYTLYTYTKEDISISVWVYYQNKPNQFLPLDAKAEYQGMKIIYKNEIVFIFGFDRFVAYLENAWANYKRNKKQ